MDCCTLSFFKGALLKDAFKILTPAGANSEVARIIRFRSEEEVQDHLQQLKSYVLEAVEIEKAGLRVQTKPIQESDLPTELKNRLNQSEELKRAFDALTPGRKRSYIIHISGAVKSQTRESRLDKCIPKILSGRGFNEY